MKSEAVRLNFRIEIIEVIRILYLKISLLADRFLPNVKEFPSFLSGFMGWMLDWSGEVLERTPGEDSLK